MPIYEYECPKCGGFEVTQRITEDALSKCPTCRRKVKKLISNTSFQLKGSGWYITDYARKGGEGGKDSKDNKDSKDTKDTKESPAPSASGSETKSDAATPAPAKADSASPKKPAAKSSAKAA
jgi:putative FmdB family regulatory protein